ncbi:MAG: hypothetical protein CL609_07550 [Anaerolineaceae bacterium]|nr:hypothetical protein [Anaerolineaceae bacterium]
MTNHTHERPKYFVAGGTLSPNAPSYVKRPTDDELYTRITAGELCYVLTPRQMGKSSLVARTLVRLKNADIEALSIDLQGSGEIDEKTFYFTLLDELQRAFRVDVDMERWLERTKNLSFSLRFRRFILDYLLAQVEGRIVIFFDEIDTMLTMPFRDNFFATIRALYNARSQEEALTRLTFVLLGVASPSELINDPVRTPFNIGSKINLSEFEASDAAPLLKGLEIDHPEHATVILERVFYWTSGHPYLTQRLCLLISEEPEKDWHDEAIDDLVYQTFLSEESRNEGNIRFIQNGISKSSNKRRLLRLYKNVYKGINVKENKSSVEQNQLLLSGLVTVQDGNLQVRNQIYRNVFDLKWIQQETETNWGVVIGVAGGLVALLAILALLYNSVLLPTQQRNYELNFLQATNNLERAQALAELASIQPLPLLGNTSPSEQSVRELFFGLENWEQQKAIYDHHHFVENPGNMLRLIQIIYISLVDANYTSSTTPLLTHMANELEFFKDQDALIVKQEIEQWLNGRRLVQEGDYDNALTAYNNAISINPNNPATLFERARVFTEIGNTSTLEDSSNYTDALTDLDRVMSFVLLGVELEEGVEITSTETLVPTAPTAIGTSELENLEIDDSQSPLSTSGIDTPTPGIKVTNTQLVTSTSQLTRTPTPTITPISPPIQTVSPVLQPISPQFTSRSQWLNLVRTFLQSELMLTNVLINKSNNEETFPNLFDSGLVELLTNYYFDQAPQNRPTTGGIYTGYNAEKGIIGTTNLSISGPNSCTLSGDSFSSLVSDWATGPYTYTYRIYIPANYRHDVVRVELFDPDSINADINTVSIARSNIAVSNGIASTTSKTCGVNSESSNRTQPCLLSTDELALTDTPTSNISLDKINPYWFVRIDENRLPPTASGGTCEVPDSYTEELNTRTRYSLSYFAQNSDGTIIKVPLVTYFGQTGDLRDGGAPGNHLTDLRWVSPGATVPFSTMDDPGVPVPAIAQTIDSFEVNLATDLPNIMVDQVTGERYIYLEVQSMSGASENGFGIWAGPPTHINSVPSEVNSRNLHVLNNPGSHSSEGVTVYGLGTIAMNSNIDRPVDIPLIDVGPEMIGQTISVSLFDSDSGAEPPIIFYFDSVTFTPDDSDPLGYNPDETDWAMAFGVRGQDDPDGIASGVRCLPGSCPTQWVSPAYNITVPGDLDNCNFENPAMEDCTPFVGGRLFVRYDGGFGDTVVWQVSLDLPDLVR